MCVPLTAGGDVPTCGVLVSTTMMPLCIWGVLTRDECRSATDEAKMY